MRYLTVILFLIGFNTFGQFDAMLLASQAQATPAVFSPDQVPNLVFWMNPDSFTDGTNILSTDGQAVTVIKNAIGGALQGTQTGTPATILNEGGIPSLNFQVSKDNYVFGTPTELALASGDYTIIYRNGNVMSVTNGGIFAKGGATSANRTYYMFQNTATAYFQSGATLSNVSGTYTGPMNQSVIVSGSTASHRVNNSEIGTMTGITRGVNPNQVMLGSRGNTDDGTDNGASFFNGTMRQLLVYNRALTEQELLDINTYLNAN